MKSQNHIESINTLNYLISILHPECQIKLTIIPKEKLTDYEIMVKVPKEEKELIDKICKYQDMIQDQLGYSERDGEKIKKKYYRFIFSRIDYVNERTFILL